MTPPSDLLAGENRPISLAITSRAARSGCKARANCAARTRAHVSLPSLRAERSNPDFLHGGSLDCFHLRADALRRTRSSFCSSHDGVRCLKLENASTRVVLAKARTHTAESFRGVQSQPIIAATTSRLCAAQRAVDGLAERFDLERLLQRRAIAIFFRKARGAVAGGEDEGAVARL